MNVLITSAGRRVSLLRAFQEQTAARNGGTFAGDQDPLAPALHLADDAFVLPPIEDPTYIDALLSIVKRRKIKLLVPTIDTELPFLEGNSASGSFDVSVEIVIIRFNVRAAANNYTTTGIIKSV